jgi:hypothetical protein
MDGHVTHTKNLFVINERGRKRNSTYHTFWLQQYLHVKSVGVSSIFRLKKMLCVCSRDLDEFHLRNTYWKEFWRTVTPSTKIKDFSKYGIFLCIPLFYKKRFCFSYAWRQTVVPSVQRQPAHPKGRVFNILRNCTRPVSLRVLPDVANTFVFPQSILKIQPCILYIIVREQNRHKWSATILTEETIQDTVKCY